MHTSTKRTIHQRLSDIETRLLRLTIDDVSLETKEALIASVQVMSLRMAELTEIVEKLRGEVKALRSAHTTTPAPAQRQRRRSVSSGD